MRSILLNATAAAVSLLCAAPAGAAILLSTSPTNGTTLTAVTPAGGEDLRNNGPFASGGTGREGPFDAYLIDEGVHSGRQSFLLHYDRGGGADSEGVVSGEFILQLAPAEIFFGRFASTAGLLSTDPANGVTYQTAVVLPEDGLATSARGLEMNDDILNTSQPGLQMKVTYKLFSDGPTLDEVRFVFGFAPVPEPGTWGLTIAGFGLSGAMARRRRALPARLGA